MGYLKKLDRMVLRTIASQAASLRSMAQSVKRVQNKEVRASYFKRQIARKVASTMSGADRQGKRDMSNLVSIESKELKGKRRDFVDKTYCLLEMQ